MKCQHLCKKLPISITSWWFWQETYIRNSSMNFLQRIYPKTPSEILFGKLSCFPSRIPPKILFRNFFWDSSVPAVTFVFFQFPFSKCFPATLGFSRIDLSLVLPQNAAGVTSEIYPELLLENFQKPRISPRGIFLELQQKARGEFFF